MDPNDTGDDFFTGLDDAEDIPEGAQAPEAAAPEPDKESGAKPDEASKPAEVDPKAQKPDAKADTKVEPPNPRDYVPIAAHLEEKAERKRLQTALEQMRAEFDALKNPPKPKAEPPDWVEDPRGYVDQSLKAVLEQLETGQKQATQTAEQAQAAAEETRFMHVLTTGEQAFVAQTPDYYQALGHLRQLRATELMTLNPDLTQPQVYDIMRREELSLAANLMRTGRNPHEVAYTLAKARGYAPAPKQTATVTDILPKVEETKQLPPDQTLGTGAGSPATGEQELQDDDVFDAAMKEMFGRRRA